jgi:hypothetical protein
MQVSDYHNIFNKLKKTQELLDKVHISSIGRNSGIRDILEGFIYHSIVREELLSKIPDFNNLSDNDRILKESSTTILNSIDHWCDDVIDYLKRDIIPILETLNKNNFKK